VELDDTSGEVEVRDVSVVEERTLNFKESLTQETQLNPILADVNPLSPKSTKLHTHLDIDEDVGEDFWNGNGRLHGAIQTLVAPVESSHGIVNSSIGVHSTNKSVV